MRELLERYRAARAVVAALAAACVLALVQAAAAHNDLDMREIFRTPAARAAPARPPATPAVAARRSPGTAPHATAAARPLRIALRRTLEHRVAADRRRAGQRLAADRRKAPLRLVTLPPSKDTLFQPPPQRPVIVSIYDDQTLRRGDAVMMRDGIHVFNGPEGGRHRRGDFVRLTRAASLDWHLRKTLDRLDRNPPNRWSS